MAQSEISILIDGVQPMDYYGYNDQHLNIIRKHFSDLTISYRGTTVKIVGDKKRCQECKNKLETMQKMLQQFSTIDIRLLQDMLDGVNPFESPIRKDGQNVIVYGVNGKPITARTRNQKKLVDMSEENDIVFALGPAGTGKTYTAVALAVRALKLGSVRRIILTRPAVEAGENLGFLPGDLKEKIDPYLRPLYDALDDMIVPEKVNQYMLSRVIEVAPLAFMRGRTLDNAFIILDEAQNCTESQLKMFLTRLGPTAKCIVTGDLSQIDLPHNQRSGLIRTLNMLRNIEGIGIMNLESADVVRHRLVRLIVEAFERADIDKRERQFQKDQPQHEDVAPKTTDLLAEKEIPAVSKTKRNLVAKRVGRKK
jgi:phosphate starvation-inducible protein PhoH and related proteins